jgi:uncharacterized protein (DUF1501 family)
MSTSSSDVEATGCAEYQSVSRRRFLGTTATGLAAASLPAWLPSVSMAQTQNSTRDIIVSVFMRGGADGLTLVAPFGDPAYYTARPTLAVARPDSSSSSRGRALNDFFMLPPGMFSLLPAYQSGDLLIVHAAGQAGTTSRSHFEAERYLEQGKPEDYAITSGWVARHLATMAPLDPRTSLRGVSITSGLPRTMVGGPRTLPIPQPRSYNLSTPSELALKRLFSGAWGPLKNGALDGLDTVNLLRSLDFDGYRGANGTTYANNQIAQAMKSIAVMIKGEIGLEAAHVDYGGWDTHAQQGSVGGAMASLMTDFSGALAAFWQDLMQGPVKARVTLVVATEFGRNVRENGTMGTDHGRAGVMFVMGPNIAGGRVLTTWPGLDRAVLEDGQDLRVTIDTRDILAEVVKDRLGNPNVSTIFPDYTPRLRGVTK